MGDLNRVARHVGGALGVARYFLDGRGHRHDRFRCSIDLPCLVVGCLREVRRRVLSLLGRRVHHQCGFVDRCDELAEFLDGEVERIGNRARDVLGNGRFNGQVAVSQAAHFVEQPENGLLVAFVLLCLFPGHALEHRYFRVQQLQEQDESQREGQQGEWQPRDIQGFRQQSAVTALQVDDGGRGEQEYRNDARDDLEGGCIVCWCSHGFSDPLFRSRLQK